MTKPSRRMEPFILGIIIGFVIVFAVNGFMVYKAMTTWTGIVTDHPYEQGLEFNQLIQAQQQQDALGWQAHLQIQGGSASGLVRLAFRLQDRLGEPLPAAKVVGSLYRSIPEGHDLTFHLEEKGDGLYLGEIRPDLAGHWEARIQVTVAGKAYRFVQRVEIP